MTQIDYRAAFKCMPGAVALLSPDLVIMDVSDGYLDAAGRRSEDIVGRNILEAFPNNPVDPGDTGPQDLQASLEAVLTNGMPDFIDPTRYDVEDSGRPGEFEERYWTIANVPVCDAGGQVSMIVHIAQEVTNLVHVARSINA
ncbi:MAG TPA: PAS domain-containing protein [Streptosporangiaceae bacterium]